MYLYIQTIVLISCAIVLGNVVLFSVINIKNKFNNSFEKYAYYFWLSVLPIFGVGMNVSDTKLIPFVTILSMFTVKALRNFWCGGSYKTKREIGIVSISVSLFALGVYLYKNVNHPYLYAIPISLGLNIYLLEVIYCTYTTKEKKRQSIYEKLFLIPLLIGLYNNVSPILGQINIVFDLVGWATALLLYQFISIIMPLIILEHSKEDEKVNLELEVAKKTRELVLEKLDISRKHKEAIMLSKENQALFNTLSHDIATPILAVDLFLNKISKICEDDNIKAAIKSASGHIQTVKGLIKSTKMQRQLNARKDVSNLAEVDVVDSLTKCIEINQVFIEKKQIKMILENELDKADMIWANPSVFILSIIGNLVSNAVKFSPIGGLIYIESFKEADDIVIEIQDSGPGIENSKLEELMSLGYTSSSVGTQGEEGSGFGLASTFNYVKEYKGELSFHKNSTGTLARVKFPAMHLLTKPTVSSPNISI